MDVAKGFVLGLMTLLIIGVVALVVLNAITDTTLALEDVSVSNETGAYINATGYTLDGASDYGFTGISITRATNDTSSLAIPATNYTVSSAGIVTNTTAMNYNNVSFGYTYDRNNEVVSVKDNGSAGITDFFSNATTWLALLGVVIIILIISVVISVVNRFGGGRTTV